jgi:hypothetical protein
MKNPAQQPGAMRMSRTTADLVADLAAITRHAMRMSRCATGSLAPETTTSTATDETPVPAADRKR